MKKSKIWINNRFVDEKDASISIFDRGFLYGDGVFETMRSYAGTVFKIRAHIDRLFDGMKTLRIKAPYSRSVFENIICSTLKKNGLKSAYIRLALTRGEGRFGIGYKDSFKPNVIVVAKNFDGYPEWMHDKGISAGIAKIRQNEFSPLAGIKSMNYLGYILARIYAKEDNYDEAIFTNTRGFVTEAATSNIFFVKKCHIVTPSLDSGILPGVARSVVIGMVRKMRLKVSERKVLPGELLRADEIFLTNSLAEILPVIRIGSKKIGSGLPGEMTKLLRISYQKEVIKEVIR